MPELVPIALLGTLGMLACHRYSTRRRPGLLVALTLIASAAYLLIPAAPSAPPHPVQRSHP